MMTLPQAFEQLRNNLQLKPEEEQKAKEKQQEVFEKLKGSLGPSESFISGSYGRRTAIRPLHDIDLFLVLPPPRPESPKIALETIRKAVQGAFPAGHQAHVQEHSVKLLFPGGLFSFDVVPAFKDPSTANFFWIPERTSGQWIRTNPRRHKEICDERDQNAGAMFKPLVQMLKLWRQHHGKPVPSFLLEVMAYEGVTAKPERYSKGLAALFRFCSERITSPVSDPAGTGNQIGFNDPQAPERLKEAAQQAGRACDLEQAGDMGAAHDIWSALLGTTYPGRKS
jgi:hypothetical protein